MSEGGVPCATREDSSSGAQSSPPVPDGSNTDAEVPRVSPGNSSASSSTGSKPSMEKLAVQLTQGMFEATTLTCRPEYLVALPLLMSISSSGEASPCDLQALGTLRACKGCQKAKTACSPGQRPCLRCTRLKVRLAPCASQHASTAPVLGAPAQLG
jgi:hypothetical protein